MLETFENCHTLRSPLEAQVTWHQAYTYRHKESLYIHIHILFMRNLDDDYYVTTTTRDVN